LKGGDIKGEEKRGRVGYSWVQGVVTLVAGEPMLTVSIAVVTLSLSCAALCWAPPSLISAYLLLPVTAHWIYPLL